MTQCILDYVFYFKRNKMEETLGSQHVIVFTKVKGNKWRYTL